MPDYLVLLTDRDWKSQWREHEQDAPVRAGDTLDIDGKKWDVLREWVDLDDVHLVFSSSTRSPISTHPQVFARQASHGRARSAPNRASRATVSSGARFALTQRFVRPCESELRRLGDGDEAEDHHRAHDNAGQVAKNDVCKTEAEQGESEDPTSK